MKTKKFIMLLAAVLLGSASAFAQSGNEPLKGDVNEDGVVDVADINAVIQIMKDGGGTGEAPVYYWYVGQTDPSTMTSISPIVSDTSSPGWREIGTTIGTYTFANPLYNSESNPISGSSNSNWHVAVPTISSLNIYDSDDVNQVTAGNWIKLSNQITIDNVTYDIYKSVGTYRKFNVFWVH